MNNEIEIKQFFVKIGSKTFQMFFELLPKFNSIIFFRKRKVHVIYQYKFKPINLLPWISFNYDSSIKTFMVRFILIHSLGFFITLKKDPKYLKPIFFQNLLLFLLIVFLIIKLHEYNANFFTIF